MPEEPPSPEVPNAIPGLSLEEAPLPMAMVEGATHIVRYANPAFCHLVEKPLEQLVGSPISKLLPEKDHCIPLLEQVFRTGKPLNHTEKDPSKSEPAFWSYTMWPLRTDELLVGVMIQVTETGPLHETRRAISQALLLGALRQDELIDTLVKTGRYQNASEVMREGLRLIEQREAEDAAKLAALRDAARIGMADFDAGRFSTFSDTSEMRKHLYSRAAKVIAKTKRG